MKDMGIFPICSTHWQKNYQDVTPKQGKNASPAQPCALCKRQTKRRAKLGIGYVRTLLGAPKL